MTDPAEEAIRRQATREASTGFNLAIAGVVSNALMAGGALLVHRYAYVIIGVGGVVTVTLFGIAMAHYWRVFRLGRQLDRMRRERKESAKVNQAVEANR